VKTTCSIVLPWPDSMTPPMSRCILATSISPAVAFRKISSGGSSE
jgi:hypothetical protein